MFASQMMKKLPELVELERLVELASDRARVSVLSEVEYRGFRFPLYSIAMGSNDPAAPVLGLFGGVHGLERIGTRVLLAYLSTFLELARWDATTNDLLSRTRLVFMPLVNPAGMYLQSRANANGVDLMRNAPVEAVGLPSYYLHAGQRLSRILPWYQGDQGAPMEVEAQALCDLVRREAFGAPLAVTLDVHSGYGALDRLWFPYARTKDPFPGLPEAFALKELLDKTYPNHVYRVEPQALQYTTHGDLWDYLYDEHRAREGAQGVYLPLCLELGSWVWIKKNVRQMFSLLGAFNPLTPHRLARTLRRHITLFEFLHRAVLSFDTWAVLPKNQREMNERRAKEIWYAP